MKIALILLVAVVACTLAKPQFEGGYYPQAVPLQGGYQDFYQPEVYGDYLQDPRFFKGKKFKFPFFKPFKFGGAGVGGTAGTYTINGVFGGAGAGAGGGHGFGFGKPFFG